MAEIVVTMNKLRSFFSIHLLENQHPALHGLRLGAIALVLAVHTTPLGEPSSWLPQITNRLWFGMDLFFVLSGFLIGSILHHILTNKGLREFPRFYVRRVFRILPLFYVVLAIRLITKGLAPATPDTLMREIFFVSNYQFKYHSVMRWDWSISLEEQFYLLSPFLMWGLHNVSRRTRNWLCGILFLTPFCFRVMEHVTNQFDFIIQLYMPTHMRFDSLITGIFLAYFVKENDSYLRRLFQSPSRSRLIAIAGIIPLAMAAALYPFSLRTNYGLAKIAVGTLTSIGYFPILLWGLYGAGPIHQLLSSKTARALATLGYGFYLVHIPVLEVIQENGPLWIAGWYFPLYISAIIGTFVCAYLLHLTVEKPALWLRQRWTES